MLTTPPLDPLKMLADAKRRSRNKDCEKTRNIKTTVTKLANTYSVPIDAAKIAYTQSLRHTFNLEEWKEGHQMLQEIYRLAKEGMTDAMAKGEIGQAQGFMAHMLKVADLLSDRAGATSEVEAARVKAEASREVALIESEAALAQPSMGNIGHVENLLIMPKTPEAMKMERERLERFYPQLPAGDDAT